MRRPHLLWLFRCVVWMLTPKVGGRVSSMEQAGLLEHGEGVGRRSEVLAEPLGIGADAARDEVEEVHSVTQRLARQTAAGAGPQRQAEVERELQERLS